MNSTAIAIPQKVQIELPDYRPMVAAAKSLSVRDIVTYQEAAALLTQIKSARRNVEHSYAEYIQAAHNAHKSLLAAKNQSDTPLLSAESHLKREVGRYQAEQERIRREEEARLAEMARKLEEERRIQQAAHLEIVGRREEAEAVLNDPTPPAPIVLASPIPKTEGISTRELWKFRIVNESLIPREYMSIDEKKIGGVVRALKSQANIPGVEVYCEAVISAKASNYPEIEE